MFFRKSFVLFQTERFSNISVFPCKYISNHLLTTPQTCDNEYLVRKNPLKLYGTKISAANNSLTQSVKNFRKETSRSDRFIKIIRIEGELDARGVTNILGNFTHVKKFILNQNVKEEIKSSEEFSRFVKALEENISKLGIEELIRTLSFVHWFNLPKDNLYILLMSTIIPKLNSLTFQKAVFVFELASLTMSIDKDKNDDLRNELIEELRFKIENEIIEKLGKEKELTDEDVLPALTYVRMGDCSNWPNGMFTRLLDSTLGNSKILKHHHHWKHIFDSCFFAIHYLKDEAEKDSAREKLFKMIYEVMLDKNADYSLALCNFLKNYAFLVNKKREPFDEEFFDDIVDYCMMEPRSFQKLRVLVSAVNLTNCLRMDVIKSAIHAFPVNLAILPSKVSLFMFYEDSLELLASVYGSRKISGKLLTVIQSTIKNHPILNDTSIWENIHLEHILRITVSLASMGIFSNDLLDFLNKRFNEIDIEKEENRDQLMYCLLSLNQAVTLLYKNYSKPFLNEKLLSTAFNKLYNAEFMMNEDYKWLKKDIYKTLKLMVPQKSCVLIRKFTKFGHCVPFVLAVNEEKKFFDFESDDENKSIEDISLPKNYKLVLMLPMVDKHYIRKEFLLKSFAKIRLDTLQAMHYIPIPILEDVWMDLSDDNKVQYLKDAIFKGINNLNKFKRKIS